jgi:hypothetical protein
VVTLAVFCEFIWRANQLERSPELGIRPMRRLEALIQWTSVGGDAALVVWAMTMA